MNFRIWLEDYQQWMGRWVHYSHGIERTPHSPKIPIMGINYKTIWNDPLGIYFFPETYKTEGGWHNYQFKFVVEMPSNLKVFDFSKFTTEEFDKILKDHNIEPVLAYRQVVPPSHGFWQTLKTHFYNRKTGSVYKSKLNKLFRDMGYEAIFDDTKAIHSGEVQLVLLDPSVKYKVIDVTRMSTSGWEEMTQVIERVVKICEKYGAVKIKREHKRYSGWDHGDILQARVSVNEEDYKEGPYAAWELRTAGIERKSPTEIHVCLSGATPRLPELFNSSICSVVKFRFMDFTETDLTVKSAMTKVWRSHQPTN